MKTTTISRSLTDFLINLLRNESENECKEAKDLLWGKLRKPGREAADLSQEDLDDVIKGLSAVSDAEDDPDIAMAREILELSQGKHTREQTPLEARYRCPDCGELWTAHHNNAQPDNCPSCSATEIRPYAVDDFGDDSPFGVTETDSTFELDALRELAVHEKTHPVTSEFGRYEVAVIRTSSRMATITVDEAEGPATAQLKALEVAGDYDFGSERHAEYISDGHTEFQQKLKVDAQYHWADSDSGLESDCSGPVTVCKVEGDVAHVRRPDGTEFEVHPSELH